MNRFAPILIITTLIFCSSNFKNKINDLQKENLKGQVKEISIIEHELINHFDTFVKGSKMSETITYFNKKGNKDREDTWILFTYFDIVLETIFKYNENDLLIEEKSYKRDKSLSSKKIYKYNNLGKIIELQNFSSDNQLEEKHIYKYNSLGDLIEIAKYKEKGRLYERNTMKYDQSGNLIELKEILPNGTLYSQTTNKYDENKNVIERKTVSKQGNSTYKFQYDSYDKIGNWISRTTFLDSLPYKVAEAIIEYY